MAYIPDQAFDDKNEVGQKAFDLFVFYCKHGSMSNNRVSVSLESAAEFFGIAYENICRINAILKKEKWIVLDVGETVLLKGWDFEKTVFRSRKNRQKLMKTSVLNTSKTDENVSFEQIEMSKTDESVSFEQEESENEVSKTDEIISFEQAEECQKLMKTSVSPLQPLKGYINYSEPALLKPTLERDILNAGARFEPFAETEKLVDKNFRLTIDETLFWIQTDKKISRTNFPAKEWLDVIEKLAPEEIHCVEGDGGFKDFYEWCSSQDWVDTVTPNLLLSQIEKYKKRDVIAQKRKRVGGRKDKDGNNIDRTRSDGSKTNNQTQSNRGYDEKSTSDTLARIGAKPKSIMR